MPRALPLPLRHTILRRWRRGQDATTIARQLGLVPRTVQQLLQQVGDATGPLTPHYDRCGRQRAADRDALHACVLQLRREHPTWGAGLLLVQLRLLGHAGLPSVRTLQRWLAQADLMPAPAGRPARRPHARAERPHQTWQIDASEHIPLATGTRVCWLRLTDECTGAILWTRVFPPGGLVDRPRRGGPARVSSGVGRLGAAGRHPRR